jgi:hypothetical protein
MRSSLSLLSTALLLIGGAVARCHGKPTDCEVVDGSIVAHTGEPVGREVTHENSELNKKA